MMQPRAAAPRSSPFALRNRDPILAVLRGVLPANAAVLEIASGTGEHAVHFAAALPTVTWQPTDHDHDALRTIAARRDAADLPNLLPPLELDASSPSWPVASVDAVVSINMIHIAPWTAAQGLMAGGERVLAPGGVLFLYGPFKENGMDTAPSNAAFDADLRQRNSAWGVRDLSDVTKLAGNHRLQLVQRVEMPANNLSLVFRRS